METKLIKQLLNEPMCLVNNSTILNLNDDCLIHLFNYLNIFDLVNVADTCTRLRRIADSLYKKYTEFEWNQFEHLPVNADLNKIISRIGTSITSLTFNGSYERLSDKDYCSVIREKCVLVKSLKLIGSHNYRSIIGESDFLPWLRDIRLENLSIFWSKMEKAFWQITTLKSLSISFCTLSESNLYWLLKNNQQIESLSLDRLVYQIDLRKLVKLKKLHTLSIAISSLKLSQLCMLIGEVKTLKRLKIQFTLRHGANKIDNNFNVFLEKLANEGVEELIVDRMLFDGETFAKLSLLKLRSLTLERPVFEKSIKNVLLKLVNTLDYMDSLEHIRLILTDIFVSVEDMFLIVTRLHQLDELNLLQTNCSVEKDLTAADLFERVDEVLRKQFNRSRRLKLTLSKCTINLFVKSEIQEFLASSHLKFVNPSYAIDNDQTSITS